jgi:hypothetical protein
MMRHSDFYMKIEDSIPNYFLQWKKLGNPNDNKLLK